MQYGERGKRMCFVCECCIREEKEESALFDGKFVFSKPFFVSRCLALSITYSTDLSLTICAIAYLIPICC